MARHQNRIIIAIAFFVRGGKANLDQLKICVKASQFGFDPPEVSPNIICLIKPQPPGDFSGGLNFLDIIKVEYSPLPLAEAPDNFGVEGKLVGGDGVDDDRFVGRDALLVLLSPFVLKWHHPVHDGATISDVA